MILFDIYVSCEDFSFDSHKAALICEKVHIFIHI